MSPLVSQSRSPIPTPTDTVILTPTPTTTATSTSTATATPTATLTVDPLASFVANPLRGTVPLTVTFVNSSTNATSYLWNFGDGSIGNAEINPTHIYTQTGIFTITLAASNGTITDTLTRPGYIKTFGPTDPQANFAASPIGS